MSVRSPARHSSAPPDVESLLRALRDHGVLHVVVGSVGAKLLGVDVQPGDLDVVPATDAANLARLIEVLRAIEARPRGPFGQWAVRADGEWRWTPRDTTPEDLAAWRPDPLDPGTLDHLFASRHGNLDIVPVIAGRYEELAGRAVTRPYGALEVVVAHVDDLLARLTVPRRPKDAARVDALRGIQRRGGSAAH